MIVLRKSVFPTSFLMVKLIESEHLCCGTATLNTFGIPDIGTILENLF